MRDRRGGSLDANRNGLESHWALFKRGLDGIYHHVSVKHLSLYAGEFSGATTPVHLDTSEQMEGMVQRAAGKRMTYELLIGPVESRLQEGLTG